jgi:hypothetical protein
MTFKEGLIRARGQIAFILALAVSTAIIVRLEYLGTEQYIEKRVGEELAKRSAVDPAAQALAASALRRAREASAASPQSLESQVSLGMALAATRYSGTPIDEQSSREAKALMDELRPLNTAPAEAARAALAAAFPELATPSGTDSVQASERF